MSRRILPIAMVFVVCFSLMSSVGILTSPVYAASNPYPQYNYYNSESDNQIACTWYAWNQVKERLGIELPNWHNGGDWYGNAGYSKGSSPKVGAIACWSKSNTPPYGHVAYVTAVNPNGSFDLVEGGSNWPQANWQGICSRTVSSGKWWPDQGFIYLSGSSTASSATPGVTFTAWENSKYTYIAETDASIGQQIDISNGSCTKTGMILYDSSRKELGRAENPSYTDHRIFFKINEEAGVTLSPGTTYQYRFWAAVNGKIYYSDYNSFKTSGTAAKSYYLDLNGHLDGKDVGNISGYGTADVYINGTRAADDCADYYTEWPAGTKYEIKDIKAASGYQYDGVSAGQLSGTIKDAKLEVRLSFSKIVTTVSSVTLNKTSLSLKPGETATLSATVTSNNPKDVTLSWASSNAKVASVSGGKITAVAAGTASITAKAGDKSAKCTVTVSEPAAAENTAEEITPAANYPLSIAAYIDGKTFENYGTYGMADIYVDGSLVAPSCGYYYDEFPAGTSYEIKNITPQEGYSFDGVRRGSLKGTIAKEPVEVVLSFSKESTETANTEAVATVREPVQEAAEEELAKPVANAPAGSDVHFTRVNIYHQDQFSDVKANQWFTDTVASSFELGLMRGNADGSFKPYGDVTVAEAITMAARIHSIYETGEEDFEQSGKWYQVYLDYAYENGIIEYAYYASDVSHKATRAQFAEIFGRALPDEALAEINDIVSGAIPDVSQGEYYAESVYKLYRAGILTGGDATGSFSPHSYITRAEAATIVARMAESNKRVSFSL